MAGVCMADDVPPYLVYIQGGQSTVTEGTDGSYEIEVNDIIPYFHISDGIQGSLIPVEYLSGLSYPLNGAIVFTGAKNESTSMISVSNLSLSDGTMVLTLHAEPLEFYEGSLLASFAHEKRVLDGSIQTENTSTRIFFEQSKKFPVNEDDDCPGYYKDPQNSPCAPAWEH